MYLKTITIRTVFLSLLLCTAGLQAAHADSEVLLQCAQKYPGDDDARLSCYDSLAHHAPAGSPDDAQQAGTILAGEAATSERSYLTKAWNLDDLSNRDPSKLGRLQPYRLNYLIFKRTNRTNPLPSSPLPDHNVLTPADLDVTELKFQMSVKADIGDQRNIDFLGIKTVRFWGTYTQQSNLQMFNTRNSSPFRETMYEPELIATLGTGYTSGLKLINLGWVHQSNGRLLPESRSWNRVYMLGGWEWNDMTSIMLRVWQRLPESAAKDDNPDIADYLGHGDLAIRWEPRDKSQSVALLLRNNLHRSNNRGFAQLDWATPVKFGSAARMHLQLTSGYGESLIDYNHHQNTVGLGFSFREW